MVLKKILMFTIIAILILSTIIGCNAAKGIYSFNVDNDLRKNKMQLRIYYKKDNVFEFSLPNSEKMLRSKAVYDYLVIINTEVLYENKELIDKIFNAYLGMEIDMKHINLIVLCDFVVNDKIIFSYGMGRESNLIWINNKIFKTDEFNIYYYLKEKFIPWNYYSPNEVYKDFIF